MASSSKIWTPSFLAFSSFEPAFTTNQKVSFCANTRANLSTSRFNHFLISSRGVLSEPVITNVFPETPSTCFSAQVFLVEVLLYLVFPIN